LFRLTTEPRALDWIEGRNIAIEVCRAVPQAFLLRADAVIE
jgi:hypothetical protein